MVVREHYIVIDVETDGPCPGINSLLQFGAVFYDHTGNELAHYSANIKEIENGVQDAATMNWWDSQELEHPGIWESMMHDRIDPAQFALQFQSLVREISLSTDTRAVCVAYPSGFDFTWLYWYLCRFNGSSCVGFSCLDMKTLGMAVLQTSFVKATKRNFPKKWFNPNLNHTHNALEDAREQGHMFFQMKKEITGTR